MNDHCVALLRAIDNEEFTDSVTKLSTRLRASLHQFAIDQRMLFYCADAADPPRIVVPYDDYLKYRILFEAHDTAMVIIVIVRRPMAWYVRPIGGSKCISR